MLKTIPTLPTTFVAEELMVEPFAEELNRGWRVHLYPEQVFLGSRIDFRHSPQVLAEFTADEKAAAVTFAESYSETKRKNQEWLAQQEKVVIA